MTASRDLVFEIGVEEIPSGPLYAATTQLKSLAAVAFKDARLECEQIDVFGAPRRLVLVVQGLSERQDDLDMRAKGPALRGAYNEDGTPTKAALGFARGKGVDVADLVRDTENGGEYVYAVIRADGLPAMDVLPGLLARLASGLDWPKSQRWGTGDTRFIRPVRWLLALYGAEVVPVVFAGLTGGRVTFGHRFLTPGPIEVPDVGDYFEALRRGRVMVDAEMRAKYIREGIEAAASGAGGTAVVPEKTFAEVVNLVESPCVGVGRFDEAFLRVPREILETAMESHQRYFPVQAADGALTNAFIVVHNGDPDRTEAIVHGHERVIRARLADAAFFYDEDLKVGMESWAERLGAAVFQEKLGSVAEKVSRLERLTEALATISGAAPEEASRALRAAHLCKSDLVSHAVVEFPSLQGVMGRYYALAGGEHELVAQAIVEHYRPRFAGDELPASVPGLLVSTADKLDTICGIFALGQAPTGSADPYALRRSAIGVLAMIIDGGLCLTLDDAIAAALDGYRGVLDFDLEQTGAAVKAFALGRVEIMLRDRGHAFDTVEAVLTVAADDPADAARRCDALTAARATAPMADLTTAYARARNLGDATIGTAYDRSIMGASETALADAIERSESLVAGSVAAADWEGALARLAELRGPIDAFFTDVLVMDPDDAVRTNRLRLLNRFTALFAGVADFSRLQG
ncbi:MAG TPA: glycine--tRNA ligase subunit beta [Coriobacteriia bacterium]